MSWEEIALGSAIRIKHGFAFKSQYFSDAGDFVVLTPGNFCEQGGFRVRTDKDRYYAGEVPDSFILQEGDLIVAMTEQAVGLLGSSAWIPTAGKYLHNQRLGLVEVTKAKKLDKRFLYHLFNTRAVRAQISASASGTKVRHTAPERIYRVKAVIPDVPRQRRIAASIDNYDVLIENNRRRIQLLEQSARLLFKEWFIQLRFPGHEHVKVVDGVPKGWNKAPLGQRVVLNYGKALKADKRIEGPYPVFGSSGIVGAHATPMVKGPAIILGRKGNVGSVFWSQKDCWPIDTVFFIDSKQSDLYLYYALQHMQFISTDVAVPGLNRDLAYSRPLLLPRSRLVTEFLGYLAPIHDQIATLGELTAKLSAARDLLLPRLMSGEIEV